MRTQGSSVVVDLAARLLRCAAARLGETRLAEEIAQDSLAAAVRRA
jgi:DNA-directed RNA polymerase specialized sigma24 family protein